nr:hypothetical protein [uncultured Mediterranean phage uvMED]
MNLPLYKGNIYETKEKALEHLEIIKDAFEEILNIEVKYTKENTLDELNAIIDSTYLKVASYQMTNKGQKNKGGLQ